MVIQIKTELRAVKSFNKDKKQNNKKCHQKTAAECCGIWGNIARQIQKNISFLVNRLGNQLIVMLKCFNRAAFFSPFIFTAITGSGSFATPTINVITAYCTPLSDFFRHFPFVFFFFVYLFVFYCALVVCANCTNMPRNVTNV